MAASVPNVPGAIGDKPEPKPNAKKPAKVLNVKSTGDWSNFLEVMLSFYPQ